MNRTLIILTLLALTFAACAPAPSVGSVRCPVHNLWTVVGLLVTLILSVSGCTILNMRWDRDFDAKMARTKKRPLANRQISPNEALRTGLIRSLLHVGLAIAMDALYGLIIFAGLFFAVVIYSRWLNAAVHRASSGAVFQAACPSWLAGI